ncbi:amino acid adenylation domain-containing protein (plasmid) [Bradyrhizobium sp. LCT2]|uniref:non-ribosomal peptide synthetase/type I polyketide synthase n=1 Tax=Bradyrhizobium sp. LCT2 TaxID=2493093 RepID=UPI001373933F|nr:non-ribosomal peptide synthetase/type I polyketide synthase [Bradyrhizobium sp. LCT2]QHP66038.1 amino acid adenylation domain-containing protein [Bradyrhizobium sp. LCT2]
MSDGEADYHGTAPPDRRARLAALLREKALQRRSFRLSSAQQRLWFVDQMVPGNVAYNVPLALRLSGPLDVDALARSFDETVRRHETLRTTFEIVGTVPHQVVAPHRTFELQHVNLEAAPATLREEEMRRVLIREAYRPFDLVRGPPMRVVLIRLSSDEHVLLITLHHIICDGWSLGVLLREIRVLYAAFHGGLPSPLPELPVQYIDFVDWQQKSSRQEIEATHLTYWRRTLAGLPMVSIPSDRPRPTVQTFRGGSASVSIDRELTARLTLLCRREGVTSFVMLLAAFNALLFRYAGHEDIVIGCPVANRSRTEIEGLIGCFVNTLVMRTRLTGAHSFRRLLANVRDAAIEAYGHQDVAFEKLVEVLQPTRSLSISPLFQVMFVQTAPTPSFEFEHLTVSPVEIEVAAAKHDLTLYTWEGQDQIRLVAEYNADLFDELTMTRMLGHLRRLLAGIVIDPDCSICNLPMLGSEERRQLLVAWNDTARPATAVETIHRMFAAQASRTPDAVALIAGDRSLSYRELDRRADRLADHLRASGVGDEGLVGVCMDRSVERVIALLGVLKAGAAYVPLDPTHPTDRLAVLLGRIGMPMVLTCRRFAHRLPNSDTRVTCLDSDWDEIERAAFRCVPTAEPAGDSLAYVIFTSGSTNEPKGILGTHRGVLNRLEWMWETYPYAAAEVCCHSVAPVFVDSVSEVFGPLLKGIAAVVIPDDVVKDPSRLVPTLAVHRISRIVLVPSLLRIVLDTCAELQARLPDLNLWIASGEVLSIALVERFRTVVGHAKLLNLYGSSEVAADVTWCEVAGPANGLSTVPIGRPIRNTRVYLLGGDLQPVPLGAVGRIHIGGDGLARGYHDQPALTAAKFVPDPFSSVPGARLYDTGDLGRYQADGNIAFIGRSDHQIKIRGFRIELEEIEAVLLGHPEVAEAVVLLRKAGAEDRIAAFVLLRLGSAITTADLRNFLRAKLPEYMIPASLTLRVAFPVTSTGKVDRAALAVSGETAEPAADADAGPDRPVEQTLLDIWRRILGRDRIGLRENFFDLGGHSLAMIDVRAEMRRTLGKEVTLVELFQYPTIEALAVHLSADSPADAEATHRQEQDSTDADARPSSAVVAKVQTGGGIAIIGMSGRFPGARDINELWRNLCAGTDSFIPFTDEDMLATGVNEALLSDPRYVKRGTFLDDVDMLDAAFFGIHPKEAELMDPQHRLLLECAWEALERAGYDGPNCRGRVGVYCGTTMSTYLLSELRGHFDLGDPAGIFQIAVGNDSSFLSSRISYKLGLKGPSLGIQTACSTSLVAVHVACRALIGGECDTALAGGVTVRVPQKTGYLHQDGSIGSPDGICRAFDAAADGTVFSNGVGVVVLKRLSDAILAGDHIHGVILGSAVNNDGNLKVGYTAPSVQGQAEVVERALSSSGVDADTIGYVEAHGTGTRLGDPIEIAALTEAFRRTTDKTGFCAIGSVKTNIGHLDAAAGVAGLIKAVLAVEHGVIPPSLHFETPNPAIDFAGSPFHVNQKLREWPAAAGHRRRAGVSSFGIGGTNAHVVVEAAAAAAASGPSRPWQLLVLSAATEPALEAATARLGGHLRDRADQNLADVAFTLQQGRRVFGHRRVAVCSDRADAIAVLSGSAPDRLLTAFEEGHDRPVGFLFPGQGTQHVRMGFELYGSEAVFRSEVDRCAEALVGELGLDLREVLFPAPGKEAAAAWQLQQTQLTQPALFVICYALARLWMGWGVRPSAMLGHSLGEYVAACLAEVFSLEDALRLVVGRARLMQGVAGGAMLAVSLSAAEVERELTAGLSVSAENGPGLCVVGGPEDAVEGLAARLAVAGVVCHRLATSHAFHSAMMDPICGAFAELVETVERSPPRLPYVSNVTGGWITSAEVTSTDYWVEQLRRPVRFGAGLATLTTRPELVLLEVGPGRTLSGLARQQPSRRVVSSLPKSGAGGSDGASILEALGRLWQWGVAVDWSGFAAAEHRGRVALPTYPFERQRYWIEPLTAAAARPAVQANSLDDWISVPVWQASTASAPAALAPGGRWLLLMDEHGLGVALATRLRMASQQVTTVTMGPASVRLDQETYALDPGAGPDYAWLLDELSADDRGPQHIVHMWSITAGANGEFEAAFDLAQQRGFFSLLNLAKAIDAHASAEPVLIAAVSNGLHSIAGEAPLAPQKASMLGALRVIPQEYPTMRCRSIDVIMPPGEDDLLRTARMDSLVQSIVRELARASSDPVVACRDGDRWVRTFAARRLVDPKAVGRLREDGVYLFVGDPDAKFAVLAALIAAAPRAKLVVLTRAAAPDLGMQDRRTAVTDGDRAAAGQLRRAPHLDPSGGGEIYVMTADVESVEQTRRALLVVGARFGGLDGVIYGAQAIRGESFQMIGDISVAECQRQFCHARGLLLLERALDGRKLDFCLVESSLSTVLGGFGLAAHAAAYAMIDAISDRHNRSSPTPWICIDWDVFSADLTQERTLLSTRLPPPITPDEAAQIYRRALSADAMTWIVVSKADLGSRIKQEERERLSPTDAASGLRQRHARPALSTPYVAPRDEIEQQLAALWQEILGIERIGIHDDFFEIGGHSLLATQLVSWVRKRFPVELPLRDLFERPTIAATARTIDELLMAKLEGLSEEQARQMV